MRIIYIFLFVFVFLSAAFTQSDMEACVTAEKEAPTVKGAVDNALETVGGAVGEGVQKTKQAVGKCLHKTQKVLEAGAQKTKDVVGTVADKTLQQIGFSMSDVSEAFECVKPIIDLLEKVSHNPHDPQTLEELRTNRCRGVVKEFAFKCINPNILVAMAVPGVGVAISNACQTIQRLKERLDDAEKEGAAIYEKKEQLPEACPKEHATEGAGS